MALAQIKPDSDSTDAIADSTLSISAQELCSRTDIFQILPRDFSLQKVIETHISLVLIGREKVIKLKKAVAFDFVDHTTLDTRWRSAINEVLLNRRLTSNVYEGIAIVQDTDLGISFSDPIEPSWEITPPKNAIEVGVVMRRLNDAHCLSNILGKQQVDCSHLLNQLAIKIASFHRKQMLVKTYATNQFDTSYNEICLRVVDNIKSLHSPEASQLIEPLQYALKKIEHYSTNFLAKNKQLFRQREEKGFIIDGHGDLRVDHIYFETNAIQIIDCIEFNYSLRKGDILNDLAFLRMSLDHFNRQDLSGTLTSSYFEELGLDCPTSLFNFYSAYRAMVRAKVSLLNAKQAESGGQLNEAEEHIEESQSYISSAHFYSLDISQPIAIVIGGLMGVGKSTLADFLGHALGLKVIKSDEVRKSLFGTARDDKSLEFEAGKYSADASKDTYQALLDLARSELIQGRSVVLDASFAKGYYREMTSRLMTKHQASCLPILCVLDDHLLRQRLIKRSSDSTAISDGRLELLSQQRSSFETPFSIGDKDALNVDTALPLNEQANIVLSAIENIGGCQQ